MLSCFVHVCSLQVSLYGLSGMRRPPAPFAWILGALERTPCGTALQLLVLHGGCSDGRAKQTLPEAASALELGCSHVCTKLGVLSQGIPPLQDGEGEEGREGIEGG